MTPLHPARSLVAGVEGSIALPDLPEGLALTCAHGKGRGHPAQLNMGDCFAYAVARTHQVPLLFKGDDLDRTDIPLPSPR